MSASAAVLALQSVPLRLSLRVTASTRSMLISALSAVLVQILAPLMLPALTNQFKTNTGNEVSHSPYCLLYKYTADGGING